MADWAAIPCSIGPTACAPESVLPFCIQCSLPVNRGIPQYIGMSCDGTSPGALLCPMEGTSAASAWISSFIWKFRILLLQVGLLPPLCLLIHALRCLLWKTQHGHFRFETTNISCCFGCRYCNFGQFRGGWIWIYSTIGKTRSPFSPYWGVGVNINKAHWDHTNARFCFTIWKAGRSTFLWYCERRLIHRRHHRFYHWQPKYKDLC